MARWKEFPLFAASFKLGKCAGMARIGTGNGSSPRVNWCCASAAARRRDEARESD